LLAGVVTAASTAGCISDTDTSTEASADPGNSAGEGTDTAQLGETAVIPDTFGLDGRMEVDDTSFSMQGQRTDNEFFLTVQGPDDSVEQYVAGDEVVVSTADDCIAASTGEDPISQSVRAAFESVETDVPPPQTTAVDGVPLSLGAFERTIEERSDVTQSGESTVGGTTVRSFTREPPDLPRGSETYHLVADSGMVRRIESNVVDWEHHSWEYRPITSVSTEWNILPAGGTGSVGSIDSEC